MAAGGGGVSVILHGADEMIAKLGAIAVAVPGELGIALYGEALDILAESIRITPIDTGTLRSTGHVTLPKLEGAAVEVEIGFGGAAADYAIFVHENLEAYHEPPTQAKFLESVVAEHAPRFAAKVGAELKLFA